MFLYNSQRKKTVDMNNRIFTCHKCGTQVDEFEYRWDVLQCKSCGDKFIKPKIREYYINVFVNIAICIFFYIIFGLNVATKLIVFLLGIPAFVFGMYNTMIAYHVYFGNA